MFHLDETGFDAVQGRHTRLYDQYLDRPKSKRRPELEAILLVRIRRGTLLEGKEPGSRSDEQDSVVAVSYTHLTLPTICSV